MRICLLPVVVVIALVSCAPTQSGIREEAEPEHLSVTMTLCAGTKLDARAVFPADAISEEFQDKGKRLQRMCG